MHQLEVAQPDFRFRRQRADPPLQPLERLGPARVSGAMSEKH